MAHGDDAGLRLPPALAPVQIVVVPIWKKAEEKEAVMIAADSIVATSLARLPHSSRTAPARLPHSSRTAPAQLPHSCRTAPWLPLMVVQGIWLKAHAEK